MYVFSIDIPFKGSQSLAKMTSNVTAVSYLHSGVNYSAVHVTAESMTPLTKLTVFFGLGSATLPYSDGEQ
jgi:hypothetical protein